MSDRKKGFDPLSSLFDAPDPGSVKQDAVPNNQAITEPGRRSADVAGQGIPEGLSLEDAPTEMAPIPEAADVLSAMKTTRWKSTLVGHDFGAPEL